MFQSCRSSIASTHHVSSLNSKRKLENNLEKFASLKIKSMKCAKSRVAEKSKCVISSLDNEFLGKYLQQYNRFDSLRRQNPNHFDFLLLLIVSFPALLAALLAFRKKILKFSGGYFCMAPEEWENHFSISDQSSS